MSLHAGQLALLWIASLIIIGLLLLAKRHDNDVYGHENAILDSAMVHVFERSGPNAQAEAQARGDTMTSRLLREDFDRSMDVNGRYWQDLDRPHQLIQLGSDLTALLIIALLWISSWIWFGNRERAK